MKMEAESGVIHLQGTPKIASKPQKPGWEVGRGMEQILPSQPSEGIDPVDTCSWASSLQNWETVNSSRLKPLSLFLVMAALEINRGG